MADDWDSGGMDMKETGARTQYLVMGGLVIVIVAALAITVAQFIGGGGGGESAGEVQPVQFQCMECNAEFSAKLDATQEMSYSGMPIDCPKCGKKKCAEQTVL